MARTTEQLLATEASLSDWEALSEPKVVTLEQSFAARAQLAIGTFKVPTPA